MTPRRNRAKMEPPSTRFIAVIGDVVSSTQIKGEHRRRLQHQLSSTFEELNQSMRYGLVAGLTITLGDEFECLLDSEMAPRLVPDLIWSVEKALPHIEIRFGIGIGTIDTDLSRDPRLMDGSTFHKAREAVREAAENGLLGGVFRGFGAEFDPILNGIGRVLHFHRAQWSPSQLRVADLLRSGLRRTEVATALKVTRQAISSFARAAGWESYREGEDGWRKAIELAARAAQLNGR